MKKRYISILLAGLLTANTLCQSVYAAGIGTEVQESYVQETGEQETEVYIDTSVEETSAQSEEAIEENVTTPKTEETESSFWEDETSEQETESVIETITEETTQNKNQKRLVMNRVTQDTDSIYSDFTYTVSGAEAAITGYTGSDATVSIPESIDGYTVTGIESNAFANCTTIKNITIPENVTTIGYDAFYGCERLNELTVNGDITDLGDSFWSISSNIKILNVGSAVTTLDSILYSFDGLAQINVDQDNQTYSSVSGVLYNKAQTELIRYPHKKRGDSYTILASTEKIGENAFSDCDELSNVELSDSLTTINSYAFWNCDELESIVLPENLTELEYGAFASCYKLEKLTVNGDIENADSAFYDLGSNIKTLNVGSAVTTLDGALCSFEGLTQINVDQDNQTYSSVSGVLYNKAQTELIRYPHKKRGNNYTVLASTEKIGENAFSDCDELTSITIPDTVKTLGENSFYDCDKLSSVSLGSSLKKIGRYAFGYCDELESIVFPEKLTTVEEDAFAYCNKLEELTVNGDITSLDSWAFYGSDPTIKTLNVGSAVTTLDSILYSFEGLTQINVDKDNQTYSSDNGVLYNKAQTKLIRYPHEKDSDTYSVIDGTERISENAFYDNDYITSVSLPDSLKKIESDAFYDCDALVAVDIPFGATTIRSCAFAYCDKLERAQIPESVEIIGYDAFSGCENLVIFCDLDSEAIQFAENYGIPFVTDTHCISFKLYKKCAAEPGERQIVVADNIRDYTVSLYNQTQNVALNGFRVYSNNIVLKTDSVVSGDEIIIRLTSKSGETIEASQTVILDEKMSASAEIIAQQKGYISTTPKTGTVSSILIYNENGDLCQAMESYGESCTSEFLNGGVYQVLYIQGSNYLWKFDTISQFEQNGLKLDTDYILKNVTITDGVATVVDDVTIPNIDIDLLRYLDSASTLYTVNTNEIISGGLLSFRIEYAFKELRKDSIENLYLTISIPSGCNYVANSLSIDGKPESDGIETDTTIEVPLTATEGVIRFSARPIDYGKLTTTAMLSFTDDGYGQTEVIGAIDVNVPYITLSSVTKTESKNITVSGLTVPKEKVAIYDGDVRIGTATANASGKWNAEVTLANAMDYSVHTLMAKVYTGTADEMESTPVSVLYSPQALTVKQFVMYYNGDSKVDLTESAYKAKQVISFNPSYPFTFTVRLSDNTSASKVNIVSTKGTEIKKLEASYDAVADQWVAEGYFDQNSSYVPGVLSVEYDGKEEDYYVDINAEIPKLNVEDLPEIYQNATGVVEENTYKEGSSDGQSIVNIALNDEKQSHLYVGSKSSEIKPSEESQYAIRDLLSEGYVEMNSNQKGTKYLVKSFETEDGMVVIDTVSYVAQGVDWRPKCDERAVLHVASVMDNDDAQFVVNELGKKVAGDFIEKGFGETASGYAGPVIDLVLNMIGETQRTTQINEAANRIQSMNISKQEKERRLMMLHNINCARAVAFAISLIPTVVGIGVSIFCPGAVAVYSLASALFGFLLNKAFSEWFNSKIQSYDLRWSIDPSGYVYEAVPSNRLSGVTTTIYYKDTDGVETLWDASEYEQLNPIQTDSNGVYAWDVPEGMWRVKFELDGYKTAYSEWMPVPPVQTEVNMGLISEANPIVKTCEMYDEYTVLTFDKYMKVDTISTKTVNITNSSGKDVRYTVEPLDAQSENGVSLATQFKITYSRKLSKGIYQLIVDTDVKDYADVSLAQVFSASKVVTPVIDSIQVDVPSEIRSGQTIEIPVSILPSDDYSEYRISCTSATEEIATVVSVSRPNEQGIAFVTVETKLPGVVKLSFLLEETSLSQDIELTVQKQEGEEEPEQQTRAVGGIITSYGQTSDAEVISILSDEEIVFQTEATEGTYTFASVLLGTYTLQVSKENHVTRTYDITVFDEDVTQDVKICLVGDVTGDGKVNTRDLNRVYAHVNGTNPLTGYEFDCGDVTGDGKINTRDLNRLYAHISETNPLW